MTIAGELGANGFVVYCSSIGPWDDAEPIDSRKKEQIQDRIKRALEWNGMVVDFD
jgi:hypothetical protein